MRVLIFCQLFPPLIYGGGEVVLWNLTRSLVARGHEVYVITQNVRGEEAIEVRSGVSIVRVGRPVDYSGALTTGLFESVTYLVFACLAGIRVGSRRRIDIVHSNTYVPALAGQICALILRTKHVMTVHDVYLLSIPEFWKKWSRQPGVGFIARFFGPFIERLLLHMPVSTIHTVSETSKSDLLRVVPGNRRIVAGPQRDKHKRLQPCREESYEPPSGYLFGQTRVLQEPRSRFSCSRPSHSDNS